MYIITHKLNRKGAKRHIWMRCRDAQEVVKELRRIIDFKWSRFSYSVYTGDWIKLADLKITTDGAYAYTCNNPVLELEAADE